FERRGTSSDNGAGKSVFLRCDETGKLSAGLLVPDATVIILHLQHPREVPAGFVQDVWGSVAGLRDVEFGALQFPRKEFIGPEKRAGSDARGGEIAAVITGIMPAARAGVDALLSG